MTSGRAGKRVWRLLLGVLAVLAMAWFTGTVLLRASLPQVDGAAAVAGLGHRVSVARDEHGRPVITGQSLADTLRALGFVHAQERYFQMDLLRRDAAGELAGLVGPAAIEHDKARRLHPARAVARQVVANLPPTQRQLLEAYTQGVNAGLRALQSKPFEYWLLGTEPRPWKPADSVLVVLAMYHTLQDADGSRERALGLMYRSLPPALYQFLIRPGGEWDAPLQGEAFDAPPIPGPAVVNLHDRSMTANVPMDAPRALPGSNAWAVSGKRAAGGRALLANDMHLPLRVPNIWYLARLEVNIPGDPIDITGVTLPGAPAVVAGSNRYLAWGFTNSYGDWVDNVRLLTNADHPGQYRVPGGWAPFGKRTETIAVNGAKPVIINVPTTRWGPVIKAADGREYAVHWLGDQPAATNMGLLKFMQLHSVPEALQAAPTVGIPPQNLVVADSDGHIGWTLMGRIPQRAGFDSSLPADWSVTGRGWQGWVPGDDYPRIMDPPHGLIWTANARVVDGKDLQLIGNGGYALGARASQIRDDLRALPVPTREDMHAIQLDTRAVLLKRWRELLLKLLDADALRGYPARAEFRQVLVDDWSGRAAVDDAAYRLVREFRGKVIAEALPPLVAACRKVDPEFRLPWLPESESIAWDLVSQRPVNMLRSDYASWREFLLGQVDASIQALKQHGSNLADRTWGERNRVRIRHPLSRAIPLLGHWLDMPARGLPGDLYMPRVQTPGFGASERLVVAPGREEDGYFTMPGGESGHPLSPFYATGQSDWAAGKAGRLMPGPPKHQLVLVPPAP